MSTSRDLGRVGCDIKSSSISLRIISLRNSACFKGATNMMVIDSVGRRLMMVAMVSVFVFVGCRSRPATETVVRVGWQPPWANQGQIVEVLKHTDLLKRENVSVEFKGFTYGGPM